MTGANEPQKYVAAIAHGPAGDPWYDTENGCWMRECKCGRTFRSYYWRHVPTLGDHLAIFGAKA